MKHNRRNLIKLIAVGAAGAAVLPKAVASERLSESDPIAVALGYKDDASTVDVTKFPKRAGAAGSKQLCSNCTLYQPSDATHGKCVAIPGKLVAGAGWCNVWAPKA